MSEHLFLARNIFLARNSFFLDADYFFLAKKNYFLQKKIICIYQKLQNLSSWVLHTHPAVESKVDADERYSFASPDTRQQGKCSYHRACLAYGVLPIVAALGLPCTPVQLGIRGQERDHMRWKACRS